MSPAYFGEYLRTLTVEEKLEELKGRVQVRTDPYTAPYTDICTLEGVQVMLRFSAAFDSNSDPQP